MGVCVRVEISSDDIVMYSVSQKKQDTKLLAITSTNINQFSKIFQ